MIPSGTVTFLFTDIEGSTRLWEKQPQAMRRALARHDDLLRQGIESHGGYVFKTVGDAFCASFDVAAEALASALAIQHLLLDEDWGETPIRVRMALHTGNVDEREGDYFGRAVNRVARLLSLGHGGQVLLSGLTEQLIRDGTAQTVEIRSLGSHRLKDLGDPEQVYQVSEPGLTADFPELNSLNTHPNNLPAQRTSFIGREAEVKAVAETLAQPDNRLLTLTGPGGTGKTRLSLQFAAESLATYKDGAFFVPLGPVSDPDLVISAITQSLGVRSTGQRPPMERLKEYLADKQILMLIDNFEHVVEAAPIVSDLLAAAPGLNVLVTSRIPLQLYGERVYQVDPLSLPESASLPPTGQLAGYEAVQLFVDRAAAVKNDFALTDDNAATIAQICSRLDGLPLAIELAAARVRMFSPQLILARLNNRLQFLGGAFKDLPERQRTLRATIEWSENLLSEADQTLFRRLAVFAGGATFEAAEAVCGSIGDAPEDGEQALDVWQGLENLLDHSLLRLSESEDELRFFLLETIREYAKERLGESGEAELIHRRHAAFFLALAETAGPEMRRSEQVVWRAHLERELDNLRAAMSWLLDRDVSQGLLLAAALKLFWHAHGHYTEGREWLARFLAKDISESFGQKATAKALNAAGYLAWFQDELELALELQEQSVHLWRELGGESGLATAMKDYAKAIWMSGDLSEARSSIKDSVRLLRQAGDEPGLGDALMWQAWFAFLDEDDNDARSSARESVKLAQRIGDVTGLAASNNVLGNIAYQESNYIAAQEFYEKGLDYFREAGDLYGIAVVLGSLSTVSYGNADYEREKIYLRERLQIARTIGSRSFVADSLYSLGLVSSLLGQDQNAHIYFDDGLRACAELDETNDIYAAECLAGLAWLLAKERKANQAIRLLGAVERSLNDLDTIFKEIYDQALVVTEEQLDEETFVSNRAAGKAMTVDEAIEYALKVNSKAGQS